MTLARIETFAAYAEYLREHLEEVSLLQKDLLMRDSSAAPDRDSGRKTSPPRG
jgi:hypothetical protein